MYFSEVSGLTVKELNKKKKELRSELFDARMKNSLGQLANQMSISESRRDIARINTVLTQKAASQASTRVKKG